MILYLYQCSFKKYVLLEIQIFDSFVHMKKKKEKKKKKPFSGAFVLFR